LINARVACICSRETSLVRPDCLKLPSVAGNTFGLFGAGPANPNDVPASKVKAASRRAEKSLLRLAFGNLDKLIPLLRTRQPSKCFLWYGWINNKSLMPAP
jgi:hypothetical protein